MSDSDHSDAAPGRPDDLDARLDACRRLIREAGVGGAVIAFSGGVDSSLLLALAASELPADSLAAVMALGPMTSEHERGQARRCAKALGVTLVEQPVNPLDDEDFQRNTPRRCYHCKRAILAALGEVARRRGLAALLTGSNADDLGDYRPGSEAEREFGVRSPLQEAGLTKAHIRAAARELGLSVWNAPSAACLVSRIPYHQPITPERLARIEAAEEFLHAGGFSQFRVRDHGDLARVEALPAEMPALLTRREELVKALKTLGWLYVAMDLAGFRSGSMNEGL